MNGDSKNIETKCPHCKGRIEFNVRETISSTPITVRADGSQGRTELSILCVTKGEERIFPYLQRMHRHACILGAEFIVALDMTYADLSQFTYLQTLSPVIMLVHSKGYLESVLDTALKGTKGQWILRLDDDEEMSYAMVRWLQTRQYLTHDVWRFPTAALWPNPRHFITTPPLWPDAHLRLVTWDYAKWDDKIHAASPVRGKMAPVSILHHKYLLKSYQERREIARNYDKIRLGAGTGVHKPFTLPEECLEEITVAPVGKGYVPSAGNLVGEGKRLSMKNRHL